MKAINEVVRKKIRNILRTKRIDSISSNVYSMRSFFEADEKQDKRSHIAFTGKTPNLWYLKSHGTILSNSKQSTPLRSHVEEEIIVLISGKLDIVLAESTSPDAKRKHNEIVPEEIVYYPSGITHCNTNIGTDDSVYYSIKWYSPTPFFRNKPKFGVFSWSETRNSFLTNKNGFFTNKIFEFQTDQLNKLHCHISTMRPGCGYVPHVDKYDVIIIVLDGKLETLGQKAGKNDIIFYAAGEPHGMKNNSDETAIYLVFEFHRNSFYSSINYLKSPLEKFLNTLKGFNLDI